MRNRIVAFAVITCAIFMVWANPVSAGRYGALRVRQTLPIENPTVYHAKLANFYTQVNWLTYVGTEAAIIERAKVEAANAAVTTHAIPYSAPPVSSSAIPAAWWPTALCEEGGSNNPTYGYFGIMPRSWNGYQGYPTAGAAPLSVQLAWEAQYIGGPPDAPGQCHSY